MRNRLAAAAALTAALVCAQAAAAPREGTASGSVSRCGGPAPGLCVPLAATVAAWGAGGRRVASERTHDARFSFLLPAGRYTLVATTASTGGLRGERRVTVAAGRDVHASIIIPVP